MKIIETIQYKGSDLTILVEFSDDNKAHIDYFINCDHVGDWKVLKPIYQKLFLALSDDVCERLNLIKWSY